MPRYEEVPDYMIEREEKPYAGYNLDLQDKNMSRRKAFSYNNEATRLKLTKKEIKYKVKYTSDYKIKKRGDR